LPLPRLIIAIALLTGTLARPAVAAADAPWTAKPAANQFGAERQSYGYTVNPGAQVQDDVVVANSGAAPLHLKLRAEPSKLAAWVRLGQDDVTVPAGQSVEVAFTLTLPKDAAPGDYAGGILTSPAQAGGPRVPVTIRLRVGGMLEPSLSVERVQVHYASSANPLGKGDATVSYTIRNTGNAILTAHQAVSASGPFGRWEVRAGRLADTPQLLPGATWKGSAPVHGVAPAGRVTATVTLTPLLTDAAGSISPLAATKASGHALTIPWTLLLAVLVVIALIVAVAVRIRRRAAVRPAVR
jgi:uncharacterized membrane protein